MSQLDKAMEEILAVQNELEEPKSPSRTHSQGWEPGVAWNGKEGTIVTGALPAENAPNWKASKTRTCVRLGFMAIGMLPQGRT